MTPSDQSKSVVRSAARTYLAYRVRCPKCGVYPSRACEDRGVAMRGVHRARDLRYNLIAAGEIEPAPGERI